MRDTVALLLALGCLLAAGGAPRAAAGMSSPVRLGRDGWFRLADGALYVPLGGFHGNVMPVSLLKLDEAERARLQPHLWNGHLDLFDAPKPVLDQWFGFLADNGVTAIRLFPRARVGLKLLDACGKLDTELQAAFQRAFDAARPHGIRFLLQIIGEPGRTCYRNRQALEEHVIPRLSPDELAKATAAQKRFLMEKRAVSAEDFLTDPDVLACTKLYLEQALDWVAKEPQVFALEVYNEQGWSGAPIDGKQQHVFTFPWEDEEIRWTAEVVRFLKQRLPEMPVCLSHPGFGVTGFDPLKWTRPTGVDFYSSHAYAGLCGETAQADFPLVSAATSAIVWAGIVNFPGEWGILNSKAPEAILRRNHRDALWLGLLARAPGFMQWEFPFPEEYRWPKKVFAALPKGFSPAPPEVAVEIGPAYRDFHTNSRYPLYSPDKLFPAFPFHGKKKQDPNIQRIYAAFRRSLEIGVPIRFVMGEANALSLDGFVAADPARFRRPVQAVGGYQLAFLEDPKLRVLVAYLRSRRVEQVSGHFLAVPVEAPLSVKLSLPDGSYALSIVNLCTDGTERRAVKADATIAISAKTGDDYLLAITPSNEGELR